MFHGHRAGVEEDQDDDKPEPGRGLNSKLLSKQTKLPTELLTLQHRRIRNRNFFSCFHSSLLAASSAAAEDKSLSIDLTGE